MAAPGAPDRFRAAIAFYPPCASLRADTTIPILLLMGEHDGVTPASECVTVAQQLKAGGKDVSWVVYPGAHHGFDNPEAGVGVLLPWGLVKYDPAAARDARRRVAVFLSNQLQRFR